MVLARAKRLSKTTVRLIEAKNIGHLATIMPDGSPQVTPVWIDHEDKKFLLVNSAEGRVKVKNVLRDPRVALSVIDRGDPYVKVVVRGRVVEIVRGQVAESHIDKLTKKYVGQERYPWRRPSEKRVILKIKP